MKIGFYSPFVDSIAGGERYLLTLASHWSKTHDVVLFWDDRSILHKAQSHLNIDLTRVRTAENVFRTRNIFKKMIASRGYDLIFFLSDGSIPTTFAKYNILHFQVPFQHISIHPIKLSRYQSVICNSDFTRRNIVGIPENRSTVIYPPVEPVHRGQALKRKHILSVGRFHPLKKQDVLIEAFRTALKKRIFEGYELVLSGGMLPADESYLRRLKTAAKTLPVRILPNTSFKMLSSLYGSAMIYWHAAGYHETNPEHMEHFGISTVEAMSAGAVPVVFNGGGLPEIVREGENGYLWANIDELLVKTRTIISGGPLRASLSKKAKGRSEKFSTVKFTSEFDKLLTGIKR